MNKTAENIGSLSGNEQVDEIKLRDWLQWANEELKVSLQQGQNLQQEISVRKIQIEESLARLMAA